MKLLVVAVGQRMPVWAQTALVEFAFRFPRYMKLEVGGV